MTTQDDSVPRYFADFVQENARQHQELGDRISGVETTLSNRISSVETNLGSRIGGVETTLGNRISGVETNLGSRIGGVEGELRIIKALAVGIFIAVGAAAVKYLFGL